MSENQLKVESNKSETSKPKSFSGSKLLLKSDLIGYTGKPILDSSNIEKLQKEFPKLSESELLEKCPPTTFGAQLAIILIQVSNDVELKDGQQVSVYDGVAKLKLFRWASKISDKLEIAKGEIDLDLNQVTELFDFVSKVKGFNIIVLGPILATLEDMKEGLTKNDLK